MLGLFTFTFTFESEEFEKFGKVASGMELCNIPWWSLELLTELLKVMLEYLEKEFFLGEAIIGNVEGKTATGHMDI